MGFILGHPFWISPWHIYSIKAPTGGLWLISGHQLEGYDGLYQGTNRMDLACIRAPTEGIWLMLGHPVKGYGLWEGIKTEGYGLCWASTEAIWRMLGHQVKGYGLWEGTKLRYMAAIGHLLKVHGFFKAPSEVIWLMLGHKTEGYGLYWAPTLGLYNCWMLDCKYHIRETIPNHQHRRVSS
jgi:hypothetical protein